MPISAPRRLAAAVLVTAPFALAACSGGGAESDTAAPTDAPACPVTPINVVASVDQWGSIVSQLGGECATVTTLLAGSSVDPHDYEPSPADAAKFDGAQLVVINGGHYDEWAAKLAAGSAPDAPVVDAVELSGGEAGHEETAEEHAEHAEAGHGEAGHEEGGENPHVWYKPAAVTGVADAVTEQLSKLAPDASEYFTERRAAVAESFKPYDDLIAKIKESATGKSYVATESVFDDMAAALGLQNKTPQGYQNSSSNETDPSPADLDAFIGLLRDKGADVLIFNTQTEGSVPDQIRSAAEQAGVPVVEVTETVPPGAQSFEDWQVDQLTSLAKALGVTV
ncbi:metal ABC transporter solute-binding protein, Zn/Mn family [Mycolicibacterium sp. GCM10028919]|uniref:metal ABC transporter solute-binding protein, Zn/Mn family n=1 Tax=Mycolicibacterium sp. GCM10028919 TaxID=3273401 RepID=UPI0036230D42